MLAQKSCTGNSIILLCPSGHPSGLEANWSRVWGVCVTRNSYISVYAKTHKKYEYRQKNTYCSVCTKKIHKKISTHRSIRVSNSGCEMVKNKQFSRVHSPVNELILNYPCEQYPWWVDAAGHLPNKKRTVRLTCNLPTKYHASERTREEAAALQLTPARFPKGAIASFAPLPLLSSLKL
jgi:hypothetical protein